MYLEAITVCIRYGDFLRITLPRNKKLFDHYIVVTSPDDSETQAVCKDNNIGFVKSTRGLKSGKFNKGIFINDGFDALRKTDWILHLDADMVLYDDSRKKIEQQAVDPDVLYGVARQLCPSAQEWDNYLQTGKQAWPRQDHRKCIGMGFFQLFNSRAQALQQRTIWYPEQFDTAGRSDRFFFRQWQRHAKLRSMATVHLEEGSAPMSTNWQGRKTPRFISSSSSS